MATGGASTSCALLSRTGSPARHRRRGRPLWFTDKMPQRNPSRLIALMFPRSPIIHVLRHPLDVVLSTFSNHRRTAFLPTRWRRRPPLCADDRAGRHYRAQMTLRYLRPLRRHHRRSGGRSAGCSISSASRQKLPCVSREPPLRADRQLRPGDRTALRPLALCYRHYLKQLSRQPRSSNRSSNVWDIPLTEPGGGGGAMVPGSSSARPRRQAGRRRMTRAAQPPASGVQ